MVILLCVALTASLCLNFGLLLSNGRMRREIEIAANLLTRKNRDLNIEVKKKMVEQFYNPN